MPSTDLPASTPSPLLSSSDFPALTAQPPQPSTIGTSEPVTQEQPDEGPTRTSGATTPATEVMDSKVAKKALKKAAATERAMERAKVAAEKKAEKDKERAEKKAEKERLDNERLEKERELKEKERLEAEKAEMEKAKAKAEKERVEKEKVAKEEARREKENTQAKAKKDKEDKAAQALKEKAIQQQQKKAVNLASTKVATSQTAPKAEQTQPPASPRRNSSRPPSTVPVPAPVSSEPTSQGPLLSKMPKKSRPATKPIRIPKEEELLIDAASALGSAAGSEAPQLPGPRANGSLVDSNSASSRGQSVDRAFSNEPTSVKDLLSQINVMHPEMNLINHPFFDASKINPSSKVPLEYGPLVHALSALSVGGGSFANNMPSGSIDNAVSSFQQLLETLTQTISDLLRLLPRTTWDDSSSFDGVLRDMLKGDDFLDEAGEEGNGKDEVAALTLALERRARWMEVQLSKLEELHRDINTAAVRAVLSFNDSGWDPHGFAPRTGNTLQKFDTLGMVNDGDEGQPGDALRSMTANELEDRLASAREAASFAEMEVREAVERMQELRPIDVDFDEYD